MQERTINTGPDDRRGGPLAHPDGPNVSPKPEIGRRTSTLLREFMAAHEEPFISLGSFNDALEDRAFGMLLFLFALPNLVPLNIPGLSGVLGVPLVLISWQLVYGRHKPWFPGWLSNRAFPRSKVERVISATLPYLERVERLLKPRLAPVVSWTGERVIGVAALILAVILTLPIPLGNWLPAFAIAIIGLALVEKDGAAAIAGVAIGIASLFVVAAVVWALVKAFFFFVAAIF